ncbi:MAG: ABC transporter permease [Acidimicrobiales bacterium]
MTATQSDETTPEASGEDPTGHTESSPAAPSRLKGAGEVLVIYGVSILAALAISVVLVATTGGSATEVLNALLDGSLRAPGRWGSTLGVAAPLLLVALGTTINARAGLINIGQEGQLIIGAAMAAFLASRIGGPGVLGLIAILLAGVAAGAIWAGIAGALKYWRSVPEVLTSLLLVTVAAQLTGWGLNYTWILLARFDEGRSNRAVYSDQLATDMRLPHVTLFGNDFPISVIVGLVLALIVTIVLTRTVWGFQIRVLGQNPRTAQRSGVSATKFGMTAMLLSGGFAGLAGAMMLAGGDFGNYRFAPGFAVNIGFDGLLVALIARRNPIAVIPIALLFAMLRTGSGFLAATGVEREITDIVQGLLVFAFLIPPAILFIRQRRRALAATRART